MPRHLSKAIPSDSSASVATAPDKNAVKKKAAIKDARPPKPGKPSFIRPETSKAGDSRPASKSKRNRFLASAKPEPERLHKILEILDQMYPLVTTALQHQNPLELLVAHEYAKLSSREIEMLESELLRELAAREPSVAQQASALMLLGRRIVEDLDEE